MVSTLVDKDRVKYANRESRVLRECGGEREGRERECVCVSIDISTLSLSLIHSTVLLVIFTRDYQ
jgi:hypothetical protein